MFAIIKTKPLVVLFSLSALLLTQGCSKMAPHPYNPLPQQLENQAQMPGFNDVRAWGDSYSSNLQNSATLSIRQEQAAHHGKLPVEMDGLALSGGGQDGAFGAGLLCGWTKSGTRPQFKLVTGISTGALIAPFAFLGPAYDAQLKIAYTTLSDRNIYTPHNPVLILLALLNLKSLPSLAKNTQLIELIEKMLDENMLKQIAAEHRKGRRLIIGTTQFNAQRLVLWDMGAIATRGTPEALQLFRKILLASASIPVTFPPQYFKVIAGGKTFDEMHVDGGVESEVILFESAIRPFAQNEGFNKHRSRKLYIIRNQRVSPQWQYVNPEIKYMALRAISSLTKSQGIGDLYRLYADAKRDGIDYNLAYIPLDFTLMPKSSYDTVYMNQLFDKGYELGRKGYDWKKYPPDFQP